MVFFSVKFIQRVYSEMREHFMLVYVNEVYSVKAFSTMKKILDIFLHC